MLTSQALLNLVCKMLVQMLLTKIYSLRLLVVCKIDYAIIDFIIDYHKNQFLQKSIKINRLSQKSINFNRLSQKSIIFNRFNRNRLKVIDLREIN